MATVKHSLLGDADLHVPKGFASAAVGSVPTKLTGGALGWASSLDKWLVFEVFNATIAPSGLLINSSSAIIVPPSSGKIVQVTYIATQGDPGSIKHQINVDGVEQVAATFTGVLSSSGNRHTISGLDISVTSTQYMNFSTNNGSIKRAALALFRVS